jgi:hypothetical protein
LYFRLCVKRRAGLSHVGAPDKQKIWLFPKPIFFQRFGLGQGWRTFLRVHVHIAGNIRRNSFACGKPVFTSTVFPIISVTSLRTGWRPVHLLVWPDPNTGSGQTYVLCVQTVITLLALRYQFKSTFIVRAPKLVCALVPNMSYTGPVSFVAIVQKTKLSLLPKVNSYTQLVLHFITTYCS